MKLSSHRHRASPAGLIAPKLAVAAGIVICVMSLIFLTPSRDELMKRLLMDGDEKSLALLLAQKDAGNSDEIAVALTAETIRLCHKEGWETSSLAMLAGFLRKNGNFEVAAHEALSHLEEIPSHARGKVFGAVIDRAVADGDLSFAQQVQMQLVESVDTLDAEIVRRAVTTYRYNGNPALALVTIDTLAEQDGKIPEDLGKLREVLLRETSQPERAFALINQRVRGTSDPDTLRELIPVAVKTGIEAGPKRQKDLIPLYEKYLATARSAPTGTFPLVEDYAISLAQTYEWTGQPEKAFDHFVKLAAQGNRPALDRCIALTPGLFRQEEVMHALVAGYEHYRSDPKLLLLAARYLGDAALRADSIKYFLEYLQHHPDDAEAHYRLAAVYDENIQFEEALASFKRAYELAPENNAYLLKVARLATTLRKYDEALGYLRTLSVRTRNRDHVEQFYTLAGGLGDGEATKEALRLLIDIGGRLTPSNYLYLASAHRNEGDAKGTLAVLREAQKKHPRHPFIRTELANTLLQFQRPDLALDALRGVKLSGFPQAAQAAVNAITSLDRTAYANTIPMHLARIGDELAGCDDLSVKELLNLAEVCTQHGDSARARRLLQRVSASGSDHGQLARAYYHLKKYRQARSHQLAHIKMLTRPTSRDYHLLGDIHGKLGESAAARAAYKKAVEILKTTTAKSSRP